MDFTSIRGILETVAPIAFIYLLNISMLGLMSSVLARYILFVYTTLIFIIGAIWVTL
jgi:hypothetical protein